MCPICAFAIQKATDAYHRCRRNSLCVISPRHAQEGTCTPYALQCLRPDRYQIGYKTAPAFLRPAIASSLYPISERISSVCSPSVGGGSRMLGRVSLNLTGMPVLQQGKSGQDVHGVHGRACCVAGHARKRDGECMDSRWQPGGRKCMRRGQTVALNGIHHWNLVHTLQPF